MRLILAFDVFGTLLDTSSFPQEIRRKQLELTWVYTVMEKFVPFREITRQAIRDYLLVNEGKEEELMNSWLNLKAYPDVKFLGDISALADVFALSNGSVEEVKDHLRRNGILGFFKGIVSAEEVRAYKPSPRVYKHFMESVGYPAFLVSSNWFDLMGARNAGMGTIYLNRRMEKLALEVDVIARDLEKLAQYLREKA
ncbi:MULTISPECIES: haloacid dehalogenase type II [Metallosphaera]|nr:MULTISPECIES: haloacid dehalogenase type II [Metallosphaera]AKV74127.1 haloacetate dehalogenase [Metallosphaera sedula]AKV76367.1 haloacetate dehalogenase [Metallosphaera sedula]AKV78618.1 haloacetate dehalogenase [Metallosphaera sedula]AKV80863.1 haloacetate dehalogenase [Metallosphaera sedula]AKV83108.1 haloacetate dehalogenase [Metallosphaera sedula]